MCSLKNFGELTLDLGQAALSGQNAVCWDLITEQCLSPACIVCMLWPSWYGVCGAPGKFITWPRSAGLFEMPQESWVYTTLTLNPGHRENQTQTPNKSPAAFDVILLGSKVLCVFELRHMSLEA